jgi:hypothetical protein
VTQRLALVPPGTSLSVRALARDTGLGRHLVQQVLLDMGVLPDASRASPADDEESEPAVS